MIAYRTQAHEAAQCRIEKAGGQIGGLTEPSAQPAASRLLLPSSARYRVSTFAPSEKPTPMSGALGYCLAIYMTATLMSSVWRAEYSCGLVIGTPAPAMCWLMLPLWTGKKHDGFGYGIGNGEEACEIREGRGSLTAAKVDDNTPVPQAALLYRRAYWGQDGSNIRLV